jgi:hypothetical protein
MASLVALSGGLGSGREDGEEVVMQWRRVLYLA